MSLDPSLLDRIESLLERVEDYLSDFDEGEIVYVRPRERYDSCIVGVDPSAGRLIYSENWLLQAIAYYEKLDADRACDFFNTYIEPLTLPKKGLRTPIFMVTATAGAVEAPSEDDPEN